MIEQSLYDVLSSSALITSIIGARIYPLVLPEDALMPAVTYSIVGGSSSPTLDTTGMQRTRIQVDCWGSTYLSAVTLRGAVVAALDGYFDTEMSIQSLQPTDFFDHELLQYRAMQEFYIYHAS